MGIFSRKISAERVVETLSGFFNANQTTLISEFKRQHITVNKEQNNELVAVILFGLAQPIIATFGDRPLTETILGKLQHDILHQHFPDKEERDEFVELFSERCDEYSKVLKPENKDLAFQFGQIFCSHFFGKNEDGSHLAIMVIVGGLIFRQMVEIKKFLDEVSQKYEITI